NGGLVDLWVLADFSKEFAPYFSNFTGDQIDVMINMNTFSYLLIKEDGSVERNPTTVYILGSDCTCSQGLQPNLGMGGAATPLFVTGCPYYGSRISVTGSGPITKGNIINNTDGSYTVKVHKVRFKLINTSGFYVIPVNDDKKEDLSVGASNWNVSDAATNSYVWGSHNGIESTDWSKSSDLSYAKGGVVLKKAIEGTMRFGKTCPGSNATTTANLNYPTVSGGTFPYNYVLQSYSSGTWNNVTTAALNVASFNNATGVATMNLTIPAASAQTLKDIPLRLRLSNPANPADTANLSDTLRFYTIPTRLYINPAPSSAIGLGAAGYARVVGASGAIDTIKDILESTVFNNRISCTKVTAAVPTDYSCYYSGGEDFAYANNQYSLYTSNSLTSTFAVKANANLGAVYVSANAGVNKAYYYIKVTNSTGCIVNTDTVLVIPKINYVAPNIQVNTGACSGTPFSMKASVPGGIKPTKWQWVIRQESCGTLAGGAGYLIGNPIDVSKQDPLTYAPAGFGGGLIYNSGESKRFSFQTMNTATTSVDAVSSGSSESNFRVSCTAPLWDGVTYGFLPDGTGDLAPKTTCQNLLGNTGMLKYVYVRYQVPGTGEWSSWAYAPTTSTTQGFARYAKDFDITANAKCWGTAMSTLVPAAQKCSGDTAVNVGSSVHLTFTTMDNTFALQKDMVYLIWQYSTNGGSTWNNWNTTNIDLKAPLPNNNTSFTNAIYYYTSPARVINQEELHRVLVSYGGCDTNSHVGATKGFARISINTNIITGDITAKVNGATMPTDSKICLGSTLDLKISNYDATATLMWQKSVDGAAWVDINQTANTYSYIPTESEIDAKTGVLRYFRVKVTVGSESAYTSAYKITANKVSPAALTTTPANLAKAGICLGSPYELRMGFAPSSIPNTFYDNVALEYSTDNGVSYVVLNTQGLFNDKGVKAQSDGYKFRAKIGNQGCNYYSDPITLKVHSLAKGSISPSILCKDQ
ncbi:MAG: hypothetical protein RRX93_08460, partial [Bacteroidales bacterium]